MVFGFDFFIFIYSFLCSRRMGGIIFILNIEFSRIFSGVRDVFDFVCDEFIVFWESLFDG